MQTNQETEYKAESIRGENSIGMLVLIGLALALVCFSPLYIDVIRDALTVSWEEQQQLVNEHEYALAQDAVREKLLAPATAVFCPFEEVEIEKDAEDGIVGFTGERWEGWVDSQNEYGVPVRHYWGLFKMWRSFYDTEKEEVNSSVRFSVESLKTRN